jgi:hypothetical protein
VTEYVHDPSQVSEAGGTCLVIRNHLVENSPRRHVTDVDFVHNLLKNSLETHFNSETANASLWAAGVS